MSEDLRKCSVLLTASTFPLSSQDGLPRFVLDLAEALSSELEVSVLAPHAPGAARSERMGSVSVRRFVYFWPPERQRLAYGNGMISNLGSSLLGKIQSLPFLASQVASLASMLRDRKTTLVNSHWMVPQGLSAALLRAAGFDFAHVLTVHGGDLSLLERLPAGGAIARRILSSTDHVFVVGRHMEKRLSELAGRALDCEVQAMGVEPELFAREAEPPSSPFSGGYLLFVGRLVEKKGLEHLLRALPEITRRRPNLGLVVIGYGPLEQELRRSVDHLGIAPSVLFAGARAHQEVAAYLRGAELVVVPSIEDRRGETEGMPTIVIEAMAVGARVVASSIAGMPDVIRHAENGWLSPAGNAPELARTILEALADPGELAIRARARLAAERLYWPEVARRYVRAFERVSRERDERRAARRPVPGGRRRRVGELVRSLRGS